MALPPIQLTLIASHLREQHPSRRRLEHLGHRDRDPLPDVPHAVPDYDHHAVVQVSHVLARLLARLNDVDGEEFAGQHQGLDDVGQRIEVEHAHALQFGHLLEIVIVGHQSAPAALLAVDSTFAGPMLQRPLDLGADYVIHSLTKYLNGQGDAVSGVVLGLREGIRCIRQERLVHLGEAMSPFNAWLIMRGLATLPLRMERHCENALKVARFLEDHSRIKRVVYPGLESHPHHDLPAASCRPSAVCSPSSSKEG